jgi:hypothetical protein
MLEPEALPAAVVGLSTSLVGMDYMGSAESSQQASNA